MGCSAGSAALAGLRCGLSPGVPRSPRPQESIAQGSAKGHRGRWRLPTVPVGAELARGTRRRGLPEKRLQHQCLLLDSSLNLEPSNGSRQPDKWLQLSLEATPSLTQNYGEFSLGEGTAGNAGRSSS